MADSGGKISGEAAPQTPTAEQLSERLAEVWQRIEAAGGSKATVQVIGVTKTFPIAVVHAAIAAGICDLGENYAQEMVAKDEQAKADGLETNWHFIGGLQRNKVKLLAGRVTLWHTIDSQRLLDEVSKRCGSASVLIQVNTTDEAQKSGCAPDEAAALVEHGLAAGLEVKGLMTLGPTGGSDPRPSFDRLRELAEVCEVSHLSMGMSADFEHAVAHGATMVRIGSTLFGDRATGLVR